MEQRMTPPSMKRGFVLVTVLIITAVGLLFGAGALLLFRFQCQMRIDRQHELEKVYAVRSALNYIKENSDKIDDDGVLFKYHTASERDLGVIVRPSELIFPNFARTELPYHLDMGCIGGDKTRIFKLNELNQYNAEWDNQYNKKLDYEYGAEEGDGAEGGTNLLRGVTNEHNTVRGIAIANLTATNNARWWVNIGMPGTGCWLQTDYGRRYYFSPREFVGGAYSDKTRDTMRLCIIRNVTNESNNVGRKHGWPLSREGERALVFEIKQKAGDKEAPGVMTFSERWYRGGICEPVPGSDMISWDNNGRAPVQLCYVGVQIAEDKVTLFYTNKGDTGDDHLSHGYVFSETKQLTKGTYDYFAYGVVRDADGRIIQSPELRAVFEIEATSDIRPIESTGGNQNVDFLTWFRVTPAYQYDVFLEHPRGTEPRRATVAQLIFTVPDERTFNKHAVLTYDTHGTDNKGFRKDEKLARENGGVH